MLRHQTVYTAVQRNDFLDHAGADKRISGTGHQKYRFNAFVKKAGVHLRHLYLIFKIRSSPQSPDHSVKMVTIDVKSVRRTDSIPVGNVKAKENHYVVAVIYKNKFDDVTALPDFYIVPSQVVVEKAVVYATGPTDLFTKDIVEYKGKWEELKCKK